MAKKETLANILAKELGYKDASELKSRISKGGDFSGNVKGRLESGEGFGSAFGGSIKDKMADIKESFSGKGLKKLGKKAYMETFSGKDIFSSYMRGRLNKDKGGEQTEETGKPEESGLGGKETNGLLKIIAKNAVSLHMMSRDVNVMRQNIVKLVKLENGQNKPGKGSKKKGKSAKEADHAAVNKADAFFLREDEREAKLESERAKFQPKTESKTPTPEKKEEGGGFLDSILGLFTNGLMSGLASLFNPMTILKLLGRVFVIGAILLSLFQGIMAGWDKWKETGDLKEAILEGLATIIDFLTLGLFGKDNIKKMFQAVEDFLDPIIDSVKDVINGIKDWVANNVGIPKFSIPVPKILQKLGAPEEIPFGPWYPFKDDPSSSQPQVTPKSVETKNKKPAEEAPEKPSTSPAAINEQDKFEKDLGVTRSASTGLPEYKGVPFFEPASKDEMKKVVDAIDSGKEGFAYKTIDTVTGREVEKKLSLKPVNKPIPGGQEPAAPTPVVASAGTGANAAATGGASSGGTTPTEAPSGPAQAAPSGGAPSAEAGSPTVPSGQALSKESSDVAEKQRMESAADMGSIINAPTNVNNKVNSSKGQSVIASAWDKTFLDFYATT